MARSKKSDFTHISKTDFFILKAYIAFIRLQKTFIKAPFFYHSDLSWCIWIETDTSDFTIREVLS